MDPNSQPQGPDQPMVPIELIEQQRPRRTRRGPGVLGSLLIVFLLLGLGVSVIVNIGFLLQGVSFSSTKKLVVQY